MKKSKIQKSTKVAFIFSLIGLLFSGTLTFQKLFTGTCSLTEGCSYFLGYPTCYYGFVFFLILFTSSLLLVLKNKTFKEKTLKSVLLYAVIAAVIFSGIFSFKDIFYPNCPLGECTYSLGIPTCIYGLFMYIVILICAIKSKN